MKKLTQNTLFNLTVAVLSVVLVGLVGRSITNTDSAWFNGLDKPTQFIPAAVFIIAWSMIYLCFAAVIFLLLQRKRLNVPTLVTLLLTGLFQWLWSLVFFRLHSLIGGLVVLVALLALAFSLFYQLIKKDKLYALILSVYPMWLTLATFLNIALWTLN